MNWGRYLLRRLGQYVVVLFGVSIIVFVITRLSGSPVALMVGLEASEATREAIRQQLGLTEPIYVQYAIYLADIVQLDFGTSFSLVPGEPAMALVLSRVPATIELTVVAVLFAFGIGLPVGVFSAIRQGDLADTAGMSFALLGQSVPSFWVGLMLIIFVAAPLFFVADIGWAVGAAIARAAAPPANKPVSWPSPHVIDGRLNIKDLPLNRDSGRDRNDKCKDKNAGLVSC